MVNLRQNVITFQSTCSYYFLSKCFPSKLIQLSQQRKLESRRQYSVLGLWASNTLLVGTKTQELLLFERLVNTPPFIYFNHNYLNSDITSLHLLAPGINPRILFHPAPIMLVIVGGTRRLNSNILVPSTKTISSQFLLSKIYFQLVNVSSWKKSR